jgi:hypothetical protein
MNGGPDHGNRQQNDIGQSEKPLPMLNIAQAGWGLRAGEAIVGSSTRNVEPSAGRLSTAIEP